MSITSLISSKRGQISTELGIIVASAVLVSIIVAYSYVKNIKNTQMDLTGKTANKTVTNLANKTYNVTQKIMDINVS
ncbi:class III signal peptide-containing protein [Methanocaldococcus sp. 28A]